MMILMWERLWSFFKSIGGQFFEGRSLKYMEMDLPFNFHGGKVFSRLFGGTF